jgi:hypothetical protein
VTMPIGKAPTGHYSSGAISGGDLKAEKGE